MVWRRQGRASKHNPAMFFCDFTSFCFSFLVHKMYIMIAFRLSLQHETAGENKWINPRGERSTWRPLSREREHRALVTAPPPSAFIHTQGARCVLCAQDAFTAFTHPQDTLPRSLFRRSFLPHRPSLQTQNKAVSS